MLLVIGSVLAIILTAEIGVRCYDWYRGQGFFATYRNPLAKEVEILPFRAFGFKLYGSRDGKPTIMGRWGESFPLEKGKETFRILCFGGSTTENGDVYKQTGLHYPLALQHLLQKHYPRRDIQVLNLGKSAYSTAHSLILLELNALDWNPDLIIISHNINDLTAAYFPGFKPDYANKYGSKFYTLSAKLLEEYNTQNLLLQHFQLYWILKNRIQRKLDQEHTKEAVFNRRSYGMEPPKAAARAFARNLESMVLLAKSRGIKVILGTQPLEPSEEYFRRHMGAKPYNDRVVYPLQKEFVAHHQAYNRIMSQVAAKEGAVLVDNDKIFDGSRKYFVDLVHYTKAGVERLARDYYDCIVSGDMVPPAR